MDTFGERIVEARKVRGYTQKQLADLLNISPTRLNYWEKNKRKPDFIMIRNIAEILQVSTEELINGTEQSNADSTYFLEQKLAQIGYNMGGNGSDGYLWIEYPDGTLEVTEDDLKQLDNDSASYLKFKLEELKEKNVKDFRKKK